MELSRLAQCLVLMACLVQSGCRTHVDGDYQLDLEQTKACVAKSAAGDPEAGKHKDEAIKLLDKTKVDIHLDPSGKMLSTTIVTLGSAPSTAKVTGTWKLEGEHITIKVQDDADTVCDIDGKRLRCHRTADSKLFESYVLVRK